MEEAQQNKNENQQDSTSRDTDIQENKCSSPRTGKGEKENKKKKKPRKRKRSAKQIERWNRYRENKYRNYVHDAVNGHADPAKCASSSYIMPYIYPLVWPVIRPADLPISRSVLYADTRYGKQVPDTQASGVSQHSKSVSFSVNDPKQQLADTSVRVRVSDTPKEDSIPKASTVSTTTPEIVSALRADAKVFVPGCLEQRVSNTNTPATERVDHPGDAGSQKIDPQPKADADVFVPAGEAGPLDEIPKVFETPAETPLPETRLRNTDVPAKLKTDHDIHDEDMFGILSVYADSGLHIDFDKMVCSNTTKEDFGYVYFSISNL
ncbi:uncharacterized protein LOC123537339 [Mercenaria mercenaria]|uniref:uncharacterized protein LOC123537339 n=1 Tax=Mercenaria mercenaria TaxID=6596 RepID=UPI00234F7FC0|nr:uncharacterized protein LOC123537339 [Mercenaria mercenaria]